MYDTIINVLKNNLSDELQAIIDSDNAFEKFVIILTNGKYTKLLNEVIVYLYFKKDIYSFLLLKHSTMYNNDIKKVIDMIDKTVYKDLETINETFSEYESDNDDLLNLLNEIKDTLNMSMNTIYLYDLRTKKFKELTQSYLENYDDVDKTLFLETPKKLKNGDMVKKYLLDISYELHDMLKDENYKTIAIIKSFDEQDILKTPEYIKRKNDIKQFHSVLSRIENDVVNEFKELDKFYNLTGLKIDKFALITKRIKEVSIHPYFGGKKFTFGNSMENSYGMSIKMFLNESKENQLEKLNFIKNFFEKYDVKVLKYYDTIVSEKLSTLQFLKVMVYGINSQNTIYVPLFKKGAKLEKLNEYLSELNHIKVTHHEYNFNKELSNKYDDIFSDFKNDIIDEVKEYFGWNTNHSKEFREAKRVFEEVFENKRFIELLNEKYPLTKFMDINHLFKKYGDIAPELREYLEYTNDISSGIL